MITDKYIGIKYNKLTAIEFSHKASCGQTHYFFKCDCGKVVTKNIYSVKAGSTKSCGCLLGKHCKKPNNFAAKNRKYGTYVHRDKIRNFKNTITFDEYCNIPPLHIAKSRTGVFICNGIDRKDNNKGYEFDNCLPCCGICNSVKGKFLSYDDMKLFMKTKIINNEDPWSMFR